MDKRALSILFDTYWSPQGWKPARQQKTPKADFEYAKKQRVMFDRLQVDHDEVVSRLRSVIRKLTPERVGDGFLASLSTRRLDWRSALGSYAVFKHLADHRPSGTKHCAVCGFFLKDRTEDLNVLNFERLKWGGVRHDYPTYALLDLELFLDESPKPSVADVALFDSLIAAIDSAPGATTSGALHKRFPAGLKGNKPERDTVVATLGFCGALATSDHPGFADRFIPWASRELPDRHFVDMKYPACWWRRDQGFDRQALKPYFAHLSKSLQLLA